MKLSFTWTLFRIIQTRIQHIVLYVLIVSGTSMLIAAVIQALLFCHPFPYAWQRVANITTEGSCHSFWTLKAMTIVHAAWVLVADIILGLVIPVMLLWGVQMPIRAKGSVYVLLGLGSMLAAKGIFSDRKRLTGNIVRA